MSKDITTTVQPSRRTLLKTVGAVGVAAAGGVLSRQIFSPAIAAPAPKIRLAWTEVAACHSPLGFGVAKGIYAKHNLDVELFYQGASGQTLIQALGDRQGGRGRRSHRRLAEAARAGLRRQAVRRLAWRLPAPARVAGFGHQGPRGRQGQDDRDLRHRRAAAGGLPGHAVQGRHRPRDRRDLEGGAVRSRRRDPSIAATRISRRISTRGPIRSRSSSTSPRSPTPRRASTRTIPAACSAPTGRSSPPTRTRCAGSRRPISRSTNTPPIIPTKWRSGTSRTSSPRGSPKRRSPRSSDRSSTTTTRSVRRSIDQIRITSEDLKLVKVLEPSTDPKAFAERITVNLLA